MFSIRSTTNGNPFENDLEEDGPSKCSSANGKRTKPFFRIPIVITFTVIVFVLLIAGTAATSISYPPKPPHWETEESSNKFETALDGDYKLIGPLLLTAGLFLLIIDIILCVIVTKDEYISLRTVQPLNVDNVPGPVSVLGGPFYLATPNPNVANPSAMIPFAFSRQLWTIPNAPTPDFTLDEETMKGSKIRPSTATLARCIQPPFNPDVKQVDQDS